MSVMVAEPAASAKRVYYGYLDGIRALAALFVVLHHVWIMQFGLYAVPGLRGLATNWLLYGHLAVDVFIVLSGFCLTLPVASAGTLRGGSLLFFKRRARRILPTYFAALVLSSALRLLAQKLGHQVHMNHPMSVKQFVLNALLLEDLVPDADYINQPFWSVAVEWKIYFLFPVIVWIWQRYRSWVTLAATAVVGYGLMVIWVWHHYHILSFVLPHQTLTHSCPWYVFLFGMGCCAAQSSVRWENARPAPWAAGAGAFVVVSALLLWLFPITSRGSGVSFDPHLPIIDAAVGAAVACLLVVLKQQAEDDKSSPLLHALSWRPLVQTGVFAYSIYLIHFPVVSVFSQLLHKGRLAKVATHPAALLGLDVTLVAFVVGLAYLFFLAFERPFLTARRKRAIPLEA